MQILQQFKSGKKQLVGISDEFKLKDLVVSKFAITEKGRMIYV